jgi:transposase
VSNWRRQERKEGRRCPKPHSGGVPSRLDAAALAVLRQLVAEDNDALLREYRERLAERTSVTVCIAVICEALKRLKLRPKKRRFGRPSWSGPRLPPSMRLTAGR